MKTLSPNAQTSLDRVVEKFKRGDLSPIRHVARITLAEDAPAKKWSFSNKILAYVQAEELDCRGYRQWQQVGRTVKKGSKAVYIVRPNTITKKSLDDDTKEVVCVGFSHIPVFPASATEGENKLLGYEPAELPPLIEVAKKLGIQISYIPITADRLGDCHPDGSKIRLGSQDPKVFFHELAHAIHARIEGGLVPGQHEEQETIAEFTTTVLMDLYGLGDTTGNAWRYISVYANDPLVAITKAMATVEKVLEVLHSDISP